MFRRDTSLAALNDGFTPRNSRDNRHGSYGNWPQTGKQWVEYDWSQPISTKQIEVYWWDDHQGVRLPKACRVKFWDGNDFIEITNASGLGVGGRQIQRHDVPRSHDLETETGDGRHAKIFPPAFCSGGFWIPANRRIFRRASTPAWTAM